MLNTYLTTLPYTKFILIEGKLVKKVTKTLNS